MSDGANMPAPAPSPTPIRDSIRSTVDEMLAQQAPGSNEATVSVNNEGIEADVNVSIHRGDVEAGIGAWARRTWQGMWSYGGRGTVRWFTGRR